MTAAARLRLPDFLIIGAFKSGTTSLTSYLGQHPQVFLPWLQEPAFFASPRFDLTTEGDTRPQRPPEGVYGRLRTETLAQYAALFAPSPEGAVLGESSPQYLRDPHACARIAQVLPDAQLVVILRQPAERAFSDYMMFVRDGLEDASFAEVVARPRSAQTGQHYVETGFYGRQLRPYYEAFPAEQIRVLLFEELTRDPLGTVRDLYAWLGVDSTFTPDVSEVRNISGVPASRTVAAAYRLRRRLQPHLKPYVPRPLVRAVDDRLKRGLRRTTADAAVMAELAEVYRDDVRLLSELTGRDLSHWSS